LAAAIAISACASVESRSAGNGGVGWSYMAPVRLVTVTAERAPALEENRQATITRARTAYVQAVTNAGAATQLRNTRKSEAEAARALANAAAGPARQELELAADRAEAAHRVAEVEAVRTQGLASAAQDTYERLVAQATADTTQWSETVRVVLGPAVGDPNHRFTADISSTPFRSASGTTIIGANGLLQSANHIADGQLDEVVVGAAQSLFALTTPGFGARGVRAPARQATAPACRDDGTLMQAYTAPAAQRRALTLTIDPTDPEQLSDVNAALCRAGFGYRLRRGEPASRTVTTGPELDKICRTDRQGELRCNGLIYRQPRPVELRIERLDMSCPAVRLADGVPRNCNNDFDEQILSMNLPNGAPLDVLPYGAAMFVTQRTDAIFADGSLVSVNYDRPSEAAVAASLPFRALRAGAEAVSNVVQLRLDLRDREGDLVRAEQELADLREADPLGDRAAELEAMQRVLRAQIEVERLRGQLTNPAPEAPD
jgi:hypothetical protein